MSPIETLKSGILSGDWALACAAYKGLTGETLEPHVQPTPSGPGPKQLVTLFRDQVSAAVHRIYGELVIGPTPKPDAKPTRKAKAKEPVIVVPTAEQTEAVLTSEEPGRIVLVPENEAIAAGDPQPDPDPITKDDINGDGPTEILKDAGVSPQRNVYNEQMKFISREGTPAEIAKVRRQGEAAAKRKQYRPEPPKHQVECSGCGRIFESPLKPSKHIGQKCGRCIRNMEKPER